VRYAFPESPPLRLLRSPVERAPRLSVVWPEMRLQALPRPREATEGFSAATAMGKAVRVLRLDSQGPGALGFGWKDVDHVHFYLLSHPDR
jgi:hypothetical protein